MNTIETTKLRLTGITRYKDVETGMLELRVGNHKKRWKAVWLTQMNFGDSRCLPRGDLTINYVTHGYWIDCPRIMIHTKWIIWIEPLNSTCWNDMGIDLYLCSNDGWTSPLPRKDFENMVTVLITHNVQMLTVEEPTEIVENSLFSNDEKAGMINFWDE